MISQYNFTVASTDGTPVFSSQAYRLYAWLLSYLSPSHADALHAQGEHPISQFLRYDPSAKTTVWSVSLLNEMAHDLFAPILDTAETVSLHHGTILLQTKTHSAVKDAHDLILESRRRDVSRTTILFHSPASFKQAKRYVIFPQERLIVQSLINQWNRFVPEYPLDDPDAFQMLADGLRISDYALRSTGFRLKETVIPGFTGRLTIRSLLSPPLAELWSTLLSWAKYSGIGIKTTLGMGGVSIDTQQQDAAGG